MTTHLFNLKELSGRVKLHAQRVLEDYVKEWTYHPDNLSEYYRAFGLNYYEDQILEAKDIIEYCEFASIHPDWIEILDWLIGFSINLQFNLKTAEITWDDSEVTEPMEKGIYQLITSQTNETDLLEYPVHSDDLIFFEKHEETIFFLLSQIKEEIADILARIDHSLAIEFQEVSYELEEGKALFDETGNFVCLAE